MDAVTQANNLTRVLQLYTGKNSGLSVLLYSSDTQAKQYATGLITPTINSLINDLNNIKNGCYSPI